jgi:hypothetical protein
MTPLFWLGVIALLVFSVLASVLIGELKALRGTVAEILGSLAKSNWRVRDELAAINKKKENPIAPEAENQSGKS